MELLQPETLKISPTYTANDWNALNKKNAAAWPTAAAIVKDRLYGRFLHFADKCLQEPNSGFVVLAINCLLAETIEQFIEGLEHSRYISGDVFGRFLEGPRFQPHFNIPEIRGAFYSDIRCGLLHQAEAKNQWLVRRGQTELLKQVGDGYIIDVGLFHAAIKDGLDDYLAAILKPERSDLRDNLWTKMAYICNVRIARGAMEDLDAAAASPTA